MTLVTTEVINAYQVELVKLKATKGNELTDIVLETFAGDQFAKSTFQPYLGMVGDADTATVTIDDHGMASGREPAKAVRVSKQIAALGCRGDYLEFIVDVNILGTTTYAILAHSLLAQVLDFSGVPVAVQHAIFGKYSPFVTPTQPVSSGMIQGIDRQVIEVVNNVDMTGTGTAVDQKIRGSSDSRVTATPVGATAAVSQWALKMKPNSDGVFVIPAGGVLWAGYGRDATKVATAT